MFVVREPVYLNRRYARPQREASEQVHRLPLDAYETEESIVLTASVPGLRPDDMEITLDDDTLIIRGEMNGLNADANYILRERFHGKFERRLNINIPVDINAAEATFEHGILTLVLPKAPEARPHRITVRTADN